MSLNFTLRVKTTLVDITREHRDLLVILSFKSNSPKRFNLYALMMQN